MSMEINTTYSNYAAADAYGVNHTKTSRKAEINHKNYSSMGEYPQQTEGMSSGKLSGDTANISEAGRLALLNKMSASGGAEQKQDVRKLSSVSSFGYANAFEKILSELSNGSVSDELVTENYSQEKVDAIKAKFASENEAKTDSFDSHVNKMAAAYQLMKDTIEEKYANPDREPEYYAADDGSIQELTKEKELEMLDKAYENHSVFMAVSTEIWAELQDFQPQIAYHSRTGRADSGSQTLQTGYKKKEIKNQAYQAFMSAISSENIGLLKETEGSLNSLRLNLNVSAPARNVLNSIWNYYVNK